MNAIGSSERRLTFRVHGHEPIHGTVRNQAARLYDVAARVAKKFSLAGTVECLNPKGQVIPDCRLADLPSDADIRLAENLTPAAQ